QSAGDRVLRQRLPRIEELTGKKLAELKETIDLKREKGSEAALAVVTSDRGKGIMDEIRRLIEEVRAEEDRALAERDRDAASTGEFTSRTILVGTFVALGLTFLAGVLITRGLTRPMRTLVDAAEHIGGGTLDHPIEIHSRDEIGTLADAIRKMAGNLRTTMV